MWTSRAVLAVALCVLFLSSSSSAVAQEDGHVTVRQVLEIYGADEDDHPRITREVGPDLDDRRIVLRSGSEREEGMVYRLGPAAVTSESIARVRAGSAAIGDQWYLVLTFSGSGAEEFAEFTSRLACLRDQGEQIRSQVAITVDDRVMSVAGLRMPVEAGGPESGVECGVGITGGEVSLDVGDRSEAIGLAESIAADGGIEAEVVEDPEPLPTETEEPESEAGTATSSVWPVVLLALLGVTIVSLAVMRARRHASSSGSG